MMDGENLGLPWILKINENPTDDSMMGSIEILSSLNICISRGNYILSDSAHKRNLLLCAERIVACVNACDGIFTESLNSGFIRELHHFYAVHNGAILFRFPSVEK